MVRALDARGIFFIKGAVEAVAYTLNVSRYTIYNYLDEECKLGEGFPLSTKFDSG